jgi:hypothetical protein
VTCPHCTCPACGAKRSAEAFYLEQAKAILVAMGGEDWADKFALAIVPTSCMPERDEADR